MANEKKPMKKVTPYQKLQAEIQALKMKKAEATGVQMKRSKVKQALAEKKRLKKEIFRAKYGKYIEAGKRTMVGLKLGMKKAGEIMEKVEPVKKPVTAVAPAVAVARARARPVTTAMPITPLETVFAEPKMPVFPTAVAPAVVKKKKKEKKVVAVKPFDINELIARLPA